MTENILHQEPPVHWVEDESIFVSEGDEFLIYELHYGSPCATLMRHPAANGPRQQTPNFPLGPVFVQQPVPTPFINHPVPNGQFGPQPLMHSYYTPKQKPIEENDDSDDDEETQDPPPLTPINRIRRNYGSKYQEYCEVMFRNIIISSLSRFQTPIRQPTVLLDNRTTFQKDKRQLEFVAGFMISNILTTVKDWIVARTSSRIEERVVNAEHHIMSLNAQQDLTVLSQKALAKSIKTEEKAINQIQGQLAQMADLTTLMEYYISEMQQVKAKHDRLWSSLATNNPDLTTIAEIFNTTSFGRLQIRDIERIRAENPFPNVLRIRVEGPIRARNTAIFDVIAFPYYTNFSGKAGYKMEYNGNLRLMRNATADCAKGIGATALKKYIQDSCQSPDFKDPGLYRWKSTFIPDLRREDPRPVASILWPFMKIQCFTRNITITGTNKTTVTSCPGYVTSVHLNSTFKTSDGIINHVGGGTRHQQYNIRVINDVLKYHIDNFRPIHKELEDSLKQADLLLEQQEQLRNSTVAFTFNGDSVSYRTVTYFVVLVILAINISILMLYIYRHRKNKQAIRHQTMSREELDRRLNELHKLGSQIQQVSTTVTKMGTDNISLAGRNSTHRSRRFNETKSSITHASEHELEPLASRQGLVAILPTIFRDA